jgi:hypothetical protein
MMPYHNSPAHGITTSVDGPSTIELNHGPKIIRGWTGVHQNTGFCFYEKNVPFKFIPVNMSGGELKTAAYLAKQPFGEMPYIVRFPFRALLNTCWYQVTPPLYRMTTGSSCSNRSRSPNISLRNTKVRGHLFCLPKETWRLRLSSTKGAWFWQQKSLHCLGVSLRVIWSLRMFQRPFCVGLWFLCGYIENLFLILRMMGLEPNRSAYDQHKASLEPKLDALDNILANQNYMGGDASLSQLLTVSLALIYHYSTSQSLISPMLCFGKACRCALTIL